MDKQRPGTVYFLRCPANGLIKIGWTADAPARRLLKIRAASPVPVEPMATTPGSIEIEREYHLRFQGDRDHCEWFRPTPELLAEIASLDPWTRAADPSRRKLVAGPARRMLAEWAMASELTIRGVTRTAAEWCDLSDSLTPMKIKTRLRLGNPVDLLLEFDGPPTLHFIIKDRRSEAYRKSRDGYERWRKAMTPDEWRTFTTWKEECRKSPSPAPSPGAASW